MENHLLKLAGSLEEINVKCPKCNSRQVVIIKNREGYYEVLDCQKCGYHNPNKFT